MGTHTTHTHAHLYMCGHANVYLIGKFQSLNAKSGADKFYIAIVL